MLHIYFAFRSSEYALLGHMVMASSLAYASSFPPHQTAIVFEQEGIFVEHQKSTGKVETTDICFANEYERLHNLHNLMPFRSVPAAFR